MTRTRLTAACLALLMTSVCGPALAQQQPNTADVIAPAALPRAVPPIPAPTSAAYPGVITLNVDASDVERGLINVTQTIPVSAGSGWPVSITTRTGSAKALAKSRSRWS